MKKKLLSLTLMCLSLVLFISAQAQVATHVVISEVYGGGGNSGALFTNDFVELYNPTSASISLDGMSIQYGSATGTTYSGKTKISGSIAAHGFYLVQEVAGSGTTMPALPTPNAIGTIAMSGTNGKVALVADTVTLTAADFAGANPSATRIIDFVGYGTANAYEGTAAMVALSNTTSGERKANATSTAVTLASGGADVLAGNGWDSNVNSADFVSQTAVNPQNSASPVEPGLGPEANILTFTLAEQYAPAVIDYTGATVTIKVAVGTFLTALTPTITVSAGASINPTSGTPQDFTNPVVYTVTASDLTTKNWTVTVTAVPQVTIHDIQYSTGSPADSPYKNEPVQTSGIITASFASGYFIQDGTSGWNGLYVYDNTHTPAQGDSITLTGKVSEYSNCTELSTITAYVVNSSANTLPTPIALTNATAKDEQYEGMLISITDGICTDTTALGRWRVVQGTDTLVIGKLMYSYTKLAVKGTRYDIKGLLNYTSGQFTLEPRDAADIQIHTGISEMSLNNVSVYPNPVSTTLFVKDIENISGIEVTDITGRILLKNKVEGTSASIEMSSLSEGTYFVRFVNNHAVVAAKTIVKK